MTRMVLKALGARVSSVTEEGNVDLWCYEMGRSFELHVGTQDAARAWGARLGDFVTIQVLAEKYEEPSATPTGSEAKP